MMGIVMGGCIELVIIVLCGCVSKCVGVCM
jgi:hypothetical protein